MTPGTAARHARHADGVARDHRARVHHPVAHVLVVGQGDSATQTAGIVRRDGHAVRIVRDTSEALADLGHVEDDVVVLDLGRRAPGAEEFAWVARVGARLPVLVLGGPEAEPACVAMLRGGADDFIVRPVSDAELLARVAVAVRRAAALSGARPPAAPVAGAAEAPAPAFEFGDVAVYPERHVVLRGGRPVALTPKELQLLTALARRRGGAASRGELLREVWGPQVPGTGRTLDTHVHWLRRKLEATPETPRWIAGVRGVGYRLALPAHEPPTADEG